MFWRGAPSGLVHRGDDGGGQPDWPRNGSILRGVVHTLATPAEGTDPRILEVLEYQPASGKRFYPTPGCWMIFDQSGPLLIPETD